MDLLLAKERAKQKFDNQQKGSSTQHRPNDSQKILKTALLNSTTHNISDSSIDVVRILNIIAF